MSNSPNNISLSSSPNFSFHMKKSRTMIFRKQMNKNPNGINSNKYNHYCNPSDLFRDGNHSPHLTIQIKNDKLFIRNIKPSKKVNKSVSNMTQDKNVSQFKGSSLTSIIPLDRTQSQMNTSKPFARTIAIQSLHDSIDDSATEKENFTNFIMTKTVSQCFICNSFLSFFPNKLFSTGQCTHLFCRRCGKNYYEEQIELGKFTLKCPRYLCDKKMDISNIKLLISEAHYQQIEKKQYLILNGAPEKNVYNNYLTNKHFIDVVKKDEKMFEEYIRLKTIFCFSCGYPALFGRNCRDYVKCLNCLQLICKYCCKAYDDDHLNIRSGNYCKVYFRTVKKKKTLSMNKKMLSQLLFILVGVLVLLIGFTKTIVGCIPLIRKCRIISYIVHLIMFCIVFISFWIVFPYYPFLFIFYG